METEKPCAPSNSSYISILEEKIKSLEKEVNLKDETIKSKNEIIKSKDEIIKSKDEIIKSKDEIIKSKDDKLKLLNNPTKVNKSENKTISYFPPNPELIKMKFKEKQYYLISHRYYDNDKINEDNTKIAIIDFDHKPRTGCKWIFEKDKDNLFSIIFDNNCDNMFNWRMFSDGNNVVLSKELSSKYELIEIEGKKNNFYIKEHISGKYLCNSKKNRDSVSYYIQLCDKIDLIEKERFVFYL